MENIRFSRIGREDVRFGTGTFEVRLADGRVVTLSEVDLGAILLDSSLNSFYEADDWTPAISFLTPGNLSVVYALRQATYTKLGNQVRAHFSLQTSSFTHTTASGQLLISGLPYTVAVNKFFPGALVFQGITKASYTQFQAVGIPNGKTFSIYGSGSGQSVDPVDAADMPTGGTVILWGTIVYETSE